MTVLVREELNESDLMWAAADLTGAGTCLQSLRERVAAARFAPGLMPAATAPASEHEVAGCTP